MAEHNSPNLSVREMEKQIEKKIIENAKQNLNIKSLINKVSDELGTPSSKVARSLYNLWKEEKIKLEDPIPPETLWRYAKSTYSLWFWLLTATVALTALTVYAIPQNPPYIYLRYILGSILVLYFPGYSLIEALYPKRKDLTPLERFALSIGLSLALVPLVGLLLNYMPWGIRLDPIFASISLLTIALAIAAVVRKYRYHMKKPGIEAYEEA